MPQWLFPLVALDFAVAPGAEGSSPTSHVPFPAAPAGSGWLTLERLGISEPVLCGQELG